MSTTNRYVCIHGHFYQPPRENPWLEAIEQQDSAAPFHDWNDRITEECYAPNAKSRMLDGEGLIVRIVNNYSRMSFNFGPTLLSWMEQKKPELHASIIEADRESARRFSGHGSAMAQAYNHPILPLSNERDRRTVVRWGIADFVHRFGRAPEAMWLPETAVDLLTLEILAEHGIAFTVLTPCQAKSVRELGKEEWQSVEGCKIDPTRAYVQKLASGRQIALFFYDGPISRAVAFERLLNKGEYLSGRLLGALLDSRTWPQLVHIATDGETYGHHHRFGDMALAQALSTIETGQQARLTNYAEFLEKHPPTHEAQIFEDTSWSCAHGIERWKSDCGCNSGGRPGWNQAWRAPLRAALDWLRDALVPRYEQLGASLLADPWKARDDYISVLLDRSPERVEEFLAAHAARPLGAGERIAALKLLEMQRHALLMYTSCGWFFDELSGIETVQVIQYAGRALQLAGESASEISSKDLEGPFLERLEKAKSNIPQHKDGRHIFENFVRPAMVDIVKVAAHHAVSSVFDPPDERTQIYCYSAEREDHRALNAGRSGLVIGRTKITSDLTGESKRLSYAVLHFGDHNIDGAVREDRGPEAYDAVAAELSDAFAAGDFPATMRLLQQHFDHSGYSLRVLFRDEQRRILDTVIRSTVSEVLSLYRQAYETNAPLMRFVRDLAVPQPRAFLSAAQLSITGQLREELEKELPDFDRMRGLLDEAEQVGVEFDHRSIGFAAERAAERLAAAFSAAPEDTTRLTGLEGTVRVARSFAFVVDLWEAQNACYEIKESLYPQMLAKAEQAPSPEEQAAAKEWVVRFEDLARLLSVRIR